MTPYKLPAQSNKLLVIVGPTSSGKSELAVRLAKRFNGEIISGDSRQIYKSMDLGTGKVPGKWQCLPFAWHPKRNARRRVKRPLKHKKTYIYKTIPHHLIDFISPKKQYSSALFQQQARKKIKEIAERGRLPILCGGTGHWIDAVVFNQKLPDAQPNSKLRARLEKKSADALYLQLQKLDPRRAANIDRHNKRRLIRALEIIITTGKPVPALSYQLPTTSYKLLWIGLNQPQAVLYQKIEKRLTQRLKAGLLKEIANLRRQGLSWKRLENFGLEYRFGAQYLQNKLDYNTMVELLAQAIKHFAKRQLTWWRRNHGIRWVSQPKQALKLTKRFLKNHA
ncbi:MAG: tRNA (adenosine(37)-N6)-dimethylallyltransferase MiaA [Patescibacteria group bacterium]|nr:tRNA (adenosine(37)-N6)-dimethylallyltransferase MiaA [Patescibacteria group bacterium]